MSQDSGGELSGNELSNYINRGRVLRGLVDLVPLKEVHFYL